MAIASYKHGTYGEFAASIGRATTTSGTVAVYIGTAPVNLIRGYADADLVNVPAYLPNWSAVQRLMGYSSDWKKFSLCEAFNMHFKSSESVGPIVAINVLDPDKHRMSAETVAELVFVNGRATLKSDTIILDTLVLLEKKEGVDYSVNYDFEKGQVVIESIGETPITGTVDAVYFDVDPAAVTEADIIGEATDDGVYAGIGSVALVYQETGVITNLIAAPGWSHRKAVYNAMVKASIKINGHWNAYVYADVPLIDENGVAIDTRAKAIEWKEKNGYDSEFSKGCWPPMECTDGTIKHMSTLWVWRQMLVDATHNGIPMETASNKAIPAVKQYFGENSKNRGFDQQGGNALNEKGISTAVFFGGQWVLWGPHTAAYDFETSVNPNAVFDPRCIFDVNIRMMMHVYNDFQREHALTIDEPMTRAKIDTIKNREKEKADALAAIGALIGTPDVDFVEDDNSTEEMIQGNFVWKFEGTPTPPGKSYTLKVAYTTAGFDSYFGEEA